ncbi:MAG: hypothetical protein MUF57_01150 [Gammaproteobacteria bacterium]|jgi:hypothetical protein|nr:hypothetical protein [Gammaproteobacteria bacterium]
MKRWAVLIASTVVCVSAQGAPSISGVSGSVVHGQSITISGSGFGTKSPAKPWVYADFEDGFNPNSDLSQYSTWASGGENFTRTADIGVNGGYAAQSYTFVGQQANFIAVIYAPVFDFNVNGQKWYLFRKSARNFAVTSDMNWKNLRPHYGEAGFYTQIGNGNLSEEGTGAVGYMCPWQSPASSVCTDSITEAQVRGNQNGDWNTEQYIGQANTSGQQNGFLRYIVNGRLAVEMPYYDYAQKNWWHGTADAVDFPVVHDVSANEPDPPNGSWTRADTIYLDTTWSRVMLSTSSTWGTASSGPLYEVQIPTAWSDTSVTVEVQRGELSNGTVYLYVVDANNDANASGYAVTLADAGGGDTTPPTVTSRTIAASGQTLTLGLDETVTATGAVPTLTNCSGGATTLSLASGSGTASLAYTISRQVLGAETGCVNSYTQPGDGIEDTAGNDLASFSNQAVTNSSTATLVALSGLTPSAGTRLRRTVTQTTIGVTTDKAATCRWGPIPGLAWADLTAYTTTGSTAHSATLAVTPGTVYQICARCLDTAAAQYSADACAAWDVRPERRLH